MERSSVDSSSVRSVGYDAETMILEIEFSTGSVYQFFDVPETVHTALMNSDSKGKFFNARIKDIYRYSRA